MHTKLVSRIPEWLIMPAIVEYMYEPNAVINFRSNYPSANINILLFERYLSMESETIHNFVISANEIAAPLIKC